MGISIKNIINISGLRFICPSLIDTNPKPVTPANCKADRDPKGLLREYLF
jgi:hypothetical protein